MVAGRESRSARSSSPGPEPVPKVRVCESGPGTSVFIEAGNTDGWVSSDLTVEVRR